MKRTDAFEIHMTTLKSMSVNALEARRILILYAAQQMALELEVTWIDL
jgi:hypothetical protein